MNRRTLLKGTGALGTAGLLAGCRPLTTTAPSSVPPHRGGSLRIGMVGAGKAESFNPSTGVSALISLARAAAVYNPLVEIGPICR
ncbi:twin-arginine translocation signal domain-containing protein [Streptomyces sp. Lzd4kr]|nr:twin-arginine translocation signal domain-containing protein [Streptomyces sp. Lzd4kr]